MTYYQMIRGVSKFDLRLQMVERSEEVGISQTAREYKTTRNTVRKWRERYRQKGLRGFEDRLRKRRDLREVKKKLRALSFIQIEAKDLSDIERYWPQMRILGLPRYQLSARGVRIGGGWFTFAEEKATTNAALFAWYLLGHL